jgi:hypothetical protein
MSRKNGARAIARLCRFWPGADMEAGNHENFVTKKRDFSRVIIVYKWYNTLVIKIGMKILDQRLSCAVPCWRAIENAKDSCFSQETKQDKGFVLFRGE